MVRKFIIYLFLSTIIFSQQLTSSISSDNINITESIIYTIKVTDTDENPIVDISSLENFFTIIAGPNIGSEYKFINGKKFSSRSISWTLIPLSYGVLEIPQFTVSISEKKFNTKSFSINVNKQVSDQAAKELFLEVKVSDNNVVVGEQVILTYTFYTRIASKVLSTEFPEYSDFWVEKLFDPVGVQFTPESWNDIEIDGYNYKYLKMYEVAIFPIKEGSFNLPSMIMKIETKNKDSSFSRLFWDDPFFDTFSQMTRAKILVSDPLNIEVSPLSDVPKDFTGAVGKFNLVSTISEKDIDEGSPTIFKLTLEGQGNLGNIGKPKISFPNDIDIFEGETTVDKNISNNFSGSITWEYNLIPRKHGLYQIDSIEVPFFNSSTKLWSIASSKPLKLNVKKSTIFDKNDKDVIFQNSKIIRYNRLGSQNWISDSNLKVHNRIFLIITLSLLLFVLPFFQPAFKFLKHKILSFIVFQSALNRSLNRLNHTQSIFLDGPRIITYFFYQKKIINTLNIDISTLKILLKKKIKEKDFEILSTFLDKCQIESFSQTNDKENNKKTINMLIKILTDIDKYV